MRLEIAPSRSTSHSPFAQATMRVVPFRLVEYRIVNVIPAPRPHRMRCGLFACKVDALVRIFRVKRNRCAQAGQSAVKPKDNEQVTAALPRSIQRTTPLRNLFSQAYDGIDIHASRLFVRENTLNDIKKVSFTNTSDGFGARMTSKFPRGNAAVLCR